MVPGRAALGVGALIVPPSQALPSAVISSGCCETGVVYGTRNDLPEFVFGLTGCEDDLTGSLLSRCDQFYVNYHGDFICSQSYWCNTSSVHTSLACHETGHTLGLLHPEDSTPAAPPGQMDYECMRTDYAMFASIYVGAQNAQALQSKSYPAGNQ